MRPRLGLGYYQRHVPFRPMGLLAYLVHLCWQLAAAIREAEPEAWILGRFDNGKDGQQVDKSKDPRAEARRVIATMVRPVVLAYPGVFSAIASFINEDWPDKADLPGLAWRAAFEHESALIVQAPIEEGGCGLPYAWGGISVGNLEPEHLALFADVFREAVYSLVHLYLPLGLLDPSADQSEDYIRRPTRKWKPVLDELGIHPTYVVGECGPYRADVSGAELARVEVAAAVAIAEEFAAAGVPLHAVFGYGVGMIGDQAPWELEGHEEQFAGVELAEGVAPMIETKRAPNGVGWWIWYVDEALHGRTPEQLAAVCREHGISHLIVKAGDGERVWSQFAKVCKPLQEAGLRVYSWSYCYGDPDAWGAEADVALAALAAGADGHVFDVEGECEGKGRSVIRTLEAVRERWPNAWLATAPLPVIDYHEPALYEASLPFVDAILPQFYWGALGREGYGDLGNLFDRWRRWTETWRAAGHTVPPIMPIGQAYGDATAEEIAAFAERARAAGCPSISFWEWVASTDAQWFAVAELATSPTPAEPPPPPKPEPPAGPEPGVSWEQVATYGHWSIARVAAREDPRDGEAFAAHVGATGGDASMPGRYGYPS